MKIVCTADYQGMADLIDPELIPCGDLLLVAGDIGGWGDFEEMESFNEWLGKLSHPYKVVIAGNHDRVLGSGADGHKIFTNATYLQDELVEIEGLRIYGTPTAEMNEFRHTTPFNAFSDPSYLKQVAEDIPEDLDILLTHGPCYGVLDWVKSGHNAGSRDLLRAVEKKMPRYHVAGHLHESHGQTNIGGITFINAALCSERNQMFKEDGSLYFDPIVFDIKPRLKQV